MANFYFEMNVLLMVGVKGAIFLKLYKKIQKNGYPVLGNDVELILIMAFTSSLSIKKGFRTDQNLLALSRNRLDVCETGRFELIKYWRPLRYDSILVR